MVLVVKPMHIAYVTDTNDIYISQGLIVINNIYKSQGLELLVILYIINQPADPWL